MSNNSELFGGCPECGGFDGIFHVGKTHFGVCHAHKTRWNFGTNILSEWRHQTEAEQRARWAKVEDYSDVKPVFDHTQLEA